MNKISSILAPSARVTSVDLDEAPPARPGSPNVGQRQGAVRINDRFNLSQQAKELAAKDTMMKLNPREMTKAKLAEAKTQEFFQNRLKPADEPAMSEKVTQQVMEKYNVQVPDEDVLAEAPSLSLDA